MSDANLSTIAYVSESTWGTTPASPSLTKIRLTGESLTHEKTTVQSEEIRDDRQISDLVEVGSQASGGIDFELSYAAMQDFFKAALFADTVALSATGTWDIIKGVTATGTLTFSGNLTAAQTVRIGDITYTVRASPTLPYEFTLGGSVSATRNNLVAAITGAAGEGTTYGTGTAPHPDVTAAAGAGDTMTVTALVEGTLGNAIVTTETSANASWGSGTLTGGVNPVIDGTAGNFSAVSVGSTIKVAGSATAGNNGLKLVTAKNGDASIITLAAGSLAANATEALTITGLNLRNGTTRKSFTIERRILNSTADPNFQVYRGMMLDGMELNFESKAIVTGSMSFLGKRGEDLGNSSLDANQVYTDAPTGDVVNATSHVGTFLMDRATTSERFKSLSISIANNLRGKDAIGESGNFDLGIGTFEVTGSIMAYFQNPAFHRRFIEHDDMAFSFRVTDPAGNTIVFTLPRVKLGTGTPAIEGRDTDVMISAEFTAIKDTDTGSTLIIDFHPA